MKAYFSCGAGDFISIESFLTDEEKRNITGFVLATRAANVIERLIRLHSLWKDLPVVSLFTEPEIFSYGVYSFYDIPHLERITKKKFPELNGVIDYSGEIVYNQQILKGLRLYNKSEFEIEPLKCDVVLDFESNNDSRLNKMGRNFTENERKIARSLFPPDYDIIETGIGKTSLEEALRYVAGATHFIGVDSMLSCYAARLNKSSLIVKTVNPIYIKWLPIYDPLNKVELRFGLTK
jgi:hypothetical protein